MRPVFCWLAFWNCCSPSGYIVRLWFSCELQAELYRIRHEGWRRGYDLPGLPRHIFSGYPDRIYIGR